MEDTTSTVSITTNMSIEEARVIINKPIPPLSVHEKHLIPPKGKGIVLMKE